MQIHSLPCNEYNYMVRMCYLWSTHTHTPSPTHMWNTIFHSYDLSLKINPDGKKDSQLFHGAIVKMFISSSSHNKKKIKSLHHLIASEIPVDAAVHQYDHPFSQPNPHHLIDINSAAAHQAPPCILNLSFSPQLLFLSTRRCTTCFQAKSMSASSLPRAVRIQYAAPVPHCSVLHTSKTYPTCK